MEKVLNLFGNGSYTKRYSINRIVLQWLGLSLKGVNFLISGMRFHLYVLFTMFCVCFPNCAYLISKCCFSTLLKN